MSSHRSFYSILLSNNKKSHVSMVHLVELFPSQTDAKKGYLIKKAYIELHLLQCKAFSLDVMVPEMM